MTHVPLYHFLHVKRATGFSLVETLVAISILLLVVVGPLTITARTAKSSTFATEQMTAQFLAQEGIELAHKVRDDYLLEYVASTLASPWSTLTNQNGPYRNCWGASGCGLMMDNNDLGVFPPVDCAIAGACLLYRATGPTNVRSVYRYGSIGAVATPFTRVIRFREVLGSTDQMRVISEVTWRTGSIAASQRVRVETILFNIYDPS